MDNVGTWEMAGREAVHPFPSPAAASALAPPANCIEPVTSHLLDEAFQLPHVEGNGMVIQPSLNNTPQPPARFARRLMHSLVEFRADFVEFGTYAFTHAVAMDGEPTVGSGSGTHVREPEEIERFRSPFSASLSMFGCVFAELDQACLAFVEPQAEFGEPPAEFLQTEGCLTLTLKADHEVVRVTDHHDVTAAAVLPPPHNPEVKYIVQEDICQERRDNRPLWRAYRRL